MIIPQRIKILGLQWEITRNLVVASTAEAYGSTVPTMQVINIDPGITALHAEQVFLHEMLHAIWWQMGLKIRNDQKNFEEDIIFALANGLHTVLKENALLS